MYIEDAQFLRTLHSAIPSAARKPERCKGRGCEIKTTCYLYYLRARGDSIPTVDYDERRRMDPEGPCRGYWAVRPSEGELCTP